MIVATWEMMRSEATQLLNNGEMFPGVRRKTTSGLNLVSTAHAAAPLTVTVIVVGPGGTVSMGSAQGSVTVTELHAAWNALAVAQQAAVPLTLAQVMEILNAVAPNLAALSMPPEFD